MNGRIVATVAIWMFLAILSSVILTTSTGAVSHNAAAAFGAVLVLAIAAAISTMTIWLTTLRDPAHQDSARLSKAKRSGRDRIERLIASLDDEDIYELEARLLARDEDAARHDRR
jgi:hypothetical protein